MVSILYMICLVLSIGNLIYLTCKKDTYVDKYYWSIEITLPIVILGYWLKSSVHSTEAAIAASCFVHLDSTVFLALVLFASLKSINVVVPGKVKMLVYGIATICLMSVWMFKDTTLYFASGSLEETIYGTMATFVYGPLVFLQIAYLWAILVALLSVFLYGFVKKGTFSKKILISYASMAIFGIIINGVEQSLHTDYTVMPALYTLVSFMIAFSYDNIQSHDLYNLIGAKQSKTGFRGFCAFDKNRCLLGFNKQFAEMIPEIKSVVIDETVPDELEFSSLLFRALNEFDERNEYVEKLTMGDRTFQFLVTGFSINEKRMDGYLLELSDITEEQNRVDVVEQYNEKLLQEVEQKTEHIQEVKNSVVLGLANMVENRTNNTNGHIMRICETVKIMMEEIRNQGVYRIDAQKAELIIRAAAMHDLGNISVDERILNKPGKLTKEEYDEVKMHTTKSGEIVHAVLDNVEDESFVEIAYNMARFHHERWDGKGYPEELLGESIPVEARIMAVAEVYDALVSKRCYKEVCSFEEAAQTMKACMGSQFDPAMRPIFVACKDKLEAHYRLNEEAF